MKLVLKILLPLLVLAACIVTARTVIANRPEPAKRPQFKSTTSIDATRVSRSDYPVLLATQGSVGAQRQSALSADVAGRVVQVADQFVVGGTFNAGDVLFEIDPRDYEIAVTLAEATEAQAQATLAEEKARSEQALIDWQRLGRKGNPSSLTMRKPQLAAARAQLKAATAQVTRAKLDLERTRITAPYNGSIRQKSVDLGQYVSKGAPVADIYATGKAEVRLPINNQQIGFLPGDSAQVTLTANIGGTNYNWPAQLVRTEGAIDERSRQLYAIAQIDNPYKAGFDTADSNPPLRIGQYIRATINGRILKDVIVIPRSALREDREVLIVDTLNTLHTRAVKVLWKDTDVAVISEGLEPGEVISLTTLGTITNGTRVRATIDGVAPPSERRATGNRPGGSTGRPASGQTAPLQAGGDGGQRMQRLKALVDAGEDIPPQARARIEARIAAGQPVPGWLSTYLDKTATSGGQ